MEDSLYYNTFICTLFALICGTVKNNCITNCSVFVRYHVGTKKTDLLCLLLFLTREETLNAS